MKTITCIVCITSVATLTGCMGGGSSCDGVTQPEPPKYTSIGAPWVSNNENTAVRINSGAMLREALRLPIDIDYHPSEIAIGISGEVDLGYDRIAQGNTTTESSFFNTNITLSLFNSAHACLLAEPDFESDIKSVALFVASSSNASFSQGDEVTSLFNVLASNKEVSGELSLPLWNDVSDYRYINTFSLTDERSSAMLVFSNPEGIEAGTYGFSLVTTLDDGTVFTSDTDFITLVD